MSGINKDIYEMNKALHSMLLVIDTHRHCNGCGKVLREKDGCYLCKNCISEGVCQL